MSKNASSPVRCVLFDLDGTLADSAPDLAAALNALRLSQGLAALPFEQLRTYTSQGVRGLLYAGVGMTPEHPDYAASSSTVLNYYAAHIKVHTQLFEGVEGLLDTLDERQCTWGIITNKHSRYTVPLVQAIGLAERAACIISGDTTAHPKPAPDPLLHACALIGIAPEDCIYVGDDRRDIEAAHAAGMRAVACRWGYLGPNEDPANWGAEFIIDHPQALLDCI